MFRRTEPEHLNEVGVAWLADQIAPQLLEAGGHIDLRP